MGCGHKTSDHPDVVNIDWSIYIRIKRNPLLRFTAPLFLDKERLERFRALPSNISAHDLSKGIPFENDSVDAVYHSHFLEHLERAAAKDLLIEIRRVLKPGGVVRIVVPDFERACRSYLEHVHRCEILPEEIKKHDDYVADVLEQSVRCEAWGTSKQRPVRRYFENLLLGDARRRGEIHRWMYDRFNLKNVLLKLSYREVRTQRYDESVISNWNSYSLDVDENRDEYKPGSLYMEALK